MNCENIKKIAVIGSLNLDYVISVERAPKIGETILSKKVEYVSGGKGANQAYTIGKLGGKVTMLGAVGNDDNGKRILQNLNSVNVDTSKIKICENEGTGIAFICVEQTGNNSIIVDSGANFAVDNAYIDENLDVIRESNIVILQLEIPFETVLYAAQIAKSMGKMVILDPAPAIENLDKRLLACVDIIKPNETEAVIVAECQNLDDAGKKLRLSGVDNVIITLGSEGCVLYSEKTGRKHFPASKNIKIVDTTAAGDSFTAGLAISLSKGKNIVKSIEYATKVAEITVTRKGAQSSVPSANEVDEG